MPRHVPQQPQGNNYYNPNSRYQPPTPAQPNSDGYFAEGNSKEFNSRLGLIGKDGQKFISDSNAHEHAFLQLQLQDCFEIIKRKDDELRNKYHEIDSLGKRVRSYVLTQDQLYKDFIRMERAYKKKEKEMSEKERTL